MQTLDSTIDSSCRNRLFDKCNSPSQSWALFRTVDPPMVNLPRHSGIGQRATRHDRMGLPHFNCQPADYYDSAYIKSLS